MVYPRSINNINNNNNNINDNDDIFLSSSFGMDHIDLWDNLSNELKGKKILDKPHVSKKLLIKAIRMQNHAIKLMTSELYNVTTRLTKLEMNSNDRLSQLEIKQKDMENNLIIANEKIMELDALNHSYENKFNLLEKNINDLNNQYIKTNHYITNHIENIYPLFTNQMEIEIQNLHGDFDSLKVFCESLETRLNNSQKNLILPSDQIVCNNNISLTMILNELENKLKKSDIVLKEYEIKINDQSNKVQDTLFQARKSLDENMYALEDVQRMLIEKADRAKVDEMIESKYEEIIQHLQKALSSVNDDEDEFKRVCQELQELVQHLSVSKADKKDLLEVKEQVLYDTRVREQVENLRTFIDLKMNRDDILSALANKADKDEMEILLRKVSQSMNASVLRASRLVEDSEKAFLIKTSKNLTDATTDRCLACNAPVQPVNRDPLTPGLTYGGGYQLNSDHSVIRMVDKENTMNPQDSNTLSFLVGIDGQIYQGEPNITTNAALSPVPIPIIQKSTKKNKNQK